MRCVFCPWAVHRVSSLSACSAVGTYFEVVGHHLALRSIHLFFIAALIVWFCADFIVTSPRRRSFSGQSLKRVLTTAMSTPGSKKDKSSPAPLSAVSVTQFIVASILFQFFLSYIITETWTWGYKSKWMYPKNWKFLIVKSLVSTLIDEGDSSQSYRSRACTVWWHWSE